jgi:hypothetical protein
MGISGYSPDTHSDTLIVCGVEGPADEPEAEEPPRDLDREWAGRAGCAEVESE